MIKKFIIIILFFSLSAQARWLTNKESEVILLKQKTAVNISADGTSITEFESLREINNDNARQNNTSLSFTYNEAAEKLEILEAYVTKNEIKHITDLKLMEDKPLASSLYGFDQLRQIIIPLANIEIGSKIFIKYRKKNLKTMLKDFFAYSEFFDVNGCYNTSEYSFIAEKPIFIEVNNPQNALEFKNTKTADNKYLITVSLNKQLCSGLDDIENNVPDRKLTWFSISSIDNLNEFTVKTAADYEKVINQSIPDSFLNIIDQASNITNQVDQLNFVTSAIIDKLTYLGNWQTVEGKIFPRDLAVIAKTATGDCKDYTAITGAILQKLGYQVEPALVNRSDSTFNEKVKLPSSTDFNHVFLKVHGKNDQIFWIDPTNISSMSDGIFPDIAGKNILVLSTKKPLYEKTPNIDFNHNQIYRYDEYHYNKSKQQTLITGSVDIKGENTLGLTGIALNKSDTSIRDLLYEAISHKTLSNDNKIMLEYNPKLHSRTAKDINVQFSYFDNNIFRKNNQGLSLDLDVESFKVFTNFYNDQLSDIFLGNPRTVTVVKKIKNFHAKNLKTLNLVINTKWLFFERKVNQKNSDLLVEYKFIIKVPYIPSEDLATKEYLTLKKILEHEIQNTAIVFN